MLAKAFTKDNNKSYESEIEQTGYKPNSQITLQNFNFQWHDFEFLITYFDRLKTMTRNTNL